MAADLIGTPAGIAWGGTSNPTAQNVAVPSGCSHFVVVWSRYTGQAINPTWTLGGVAPTRSGVSPGGDDTLTGYAIWDNPTPGATVALDPDFGAASSSESLTATLSTVFAVQDGDASSEWTIEALPSGESQGASRTFTLTGLTAGQLVVQFDTHDDGGGTVPGTPSGWTSVVTQDLAGGESRLSRINTAGTSQACAAQAPLSWSTLLGMAIPEAGDEPEEYAGDLAAGSQAAAAAFVGTYAPPEYAGALVARSQGAAANFTGSYTAPGAVGSLSAESQTAAASFEGSYVAPRYTGTLGAEAGAATAQFAGDFTNPPGGFLAAASGPASAAFVGTYADPVYEGALAAASGDAESAFSGSYAVPVYTGTLAAVSGPAAARFTNVPPPVVVPLVTLVRPLRFVTELETPLRFVTEITRTLKF